MNWLEIEKLAQSLHAGVAETHISWILLTAREAYKIKKPVKTSFLDFSTLQQRKKYCKEELRLNKVLCPDIYKEVVAIRRVGEDFFIDQQKGKVWDYAVRMKKLDPGKHMHYMLEKDKVTFKHMDQLARIIAGFHSVTATERKAKSLQERLSEFNDLWNIKPLIASELGEKEVLKVKAAVAKVGSFLKKNNDLFLERIRQGYVKDCHGDLHSGNIFLYNPPVLFDRIEFNERFRHIDVLHETGFLCMDLESAGRKDLSIHFFSEYIKRSGMGFGQRESKLLNYYKAYTANVRLKVVLLKGKLSLKEKRMAKKYFNLMIKYSSKL